MVETIRAGFHIALFFALSFATTASPALAGADPDNIKQSLAEGAELFTREWLPGDKRSYAGSGLGPVFNARSCSTCHRQGGIGGAGPSGGNTTIVTAFLEREGGGLRAPTGLYDQDPPQPLKPAELAKLTKIHPLLRSQGSFPLHRFSTDDGFQKWNSDWRGRLDAPFRAGLGFGGGGAGFGGGGFGGGFSGGASKSGNATGPNGGLGGGDSRTGADVRSSGASKEEFDAQVVLYQSQRNTPPLFGAALIDRIPARVLEEVAAEQAAAAANPVDSAKEPRWRRRNDDYGQVEIALSVSGRVSHLKDSRIGRFGWKADVATLREFTLRACANELGLELPGYARAAPPWIKDYKASGLDMTAEQCDRLVEYVASLPTAGVRTPETSQHRIELETGRKLFGTLGCAICHRPKLGDVEGIYSDLLLHDMGIYLGSFWKHRFNHRYDPTKRKDSAGINDWRTPPLWGLRDSGPYLHDGRAETIEDAILMHGGEGVTAVIAFEKLTLRERLQLDFFLQSLTAPAGINLK
jgi:CxxC motif-containing protein (DUF1111 family)